MKILESLVKSYFTFHYCIGIAIGLIFFCGYMILTSRKKKSQGQSVSKKEILCGRDLSIYLAFTFILFLARGFQMKTKQVIFSILTLIWVEIIFSFSLQPAEISSDISSSFGKKLLEILCPNFVDRLELMPQEQLEFWHMVLRKCAHFAEYMILGVLSGISLIHMELRRRSLVGIGFCMIVAVLDETIQLFVDGRAGKLIDVLLDGAGATVGIALLILCAPALRLLLPGR